LREALKVLVEEKLSLPEEHVKVLNDIAWICFRRSNLDLAEELLLKALSMVGDTTQYDTLASIYDRLGGIYYKKNSYEEAYDHVYKSLVLREKIGDIAAVARSYNDLGLMAWRRGGWDRALSNFVHSSDLQAELGDFEGEVESHLNLGILLSACGDIEEAKRHLGIALVLSQQIGHQHHIGYAHLCLTWLNVSTEDWDTALKYSKLSLDCLREFGTTDLLVDLYTYTGMAWLGMGDLDMADKWGQDAQAVLEEIESDETPRRFEEHGHTIRLLGDIARARGYHEEAAQRYEQCEAIFESEGNALERGRTIVSVALLASDRGQYQQARDLFHEARDIFFVLGASLDLRKLDRMLQRLKMS